MLGLFMKIMLTNISNDGEEVPSTTEYILDEDGDKLLDEDGDTLIFD